MMLDGNRKKETDDWIKTLAQPYKPIFQEKNLLLGTGDTVIVTGWTPVERVAKLLDKSQYAVIGSLYSPARGLNFLVRNLLANPQYNRVVVIEATEQDKISGGCKAFMSFFTAGMALELFCGDTDNYRTLTTPPGVIDRCIPVEDLNALRKRLAVVQIDSLSKLTGAIAILSWQYPNVTAEPKTYPYIEATSDILPSDVTGHKVREKTIAEAWIQIIKRIRLNGIVRPCSTGQWQELIDLAVVVTNEPEEFYFPEPNYLPCDRNALERYIPSMLEDADDVEGVKYTYGQRMRSWFKRDQIQQVIDKLSVEPDAASAVISLWDVEDHERGGSPCLNHVWFRISKNKLILSALFRSNDMFSAWVLNAMALRALQGYVVNGINEAKKTNYKVGDLMPQLEKGDLITISQSAHIYSDSWSFADDLIARKVSVKQAYSDPVGNFLISHGDNQQIVVVQLSPQGDRVREYSGYFPLKLAREVISSNPSILPDHAAYIAIEIQKSASDPNYVQDR